MKQVEVEIGLYVVVSDADDTKIYIVEDIQGRNALLVYPLFKGDVASAGVVDVSMLSLPTNKQIRHNMDEAIEEYFAHDTESVSARFRQHYQNLKNMESLGSRISKHKTMERGWEL